MSKQKFNLEDYDMVKDRIDAYVEEHPDYRVETEVVFTSKPNADVAIVKASIYKDRNDQLERVPHGTGIAEETRDAGFVNKTSHVENAETSAIGRALANVAFKMSDKRPSKEEMEKVKRTEEAKSKDEEKPPFDTEDEDKVPDDEIEEKIMSIDKMPKVVKFFNTEIAKRKGKDKEEFEEKYRDIANKRIAQLKDE